MKTLRRSLWSLLVVAAAFSVPCAANAAQVQITRYDVEQTPASGMGRRNRPVRLCPSVGRDGDHSSDAGAQP